MNSDSQFRSSNNLTTAGCLVWQHFDEPLFGRLRTRRRGRSSRCSETIIETCVWKFQNRYRQFEFNSLRQRVSGLRHSPGMSAKSARLGAMRTPDGARIALGGAR
jgi:hypothetical protein